MGATLCSRVTDRWNRRHTLPDDFEYSDDLQRLIDRWKITEPELVYFLHRFQALDKNHNGKVEFDEFFSFLKAERSRFQDVMFEFIARAHEEPGQPLELDFTKWMIAVFTFAFATQEEIIEQIFEAYDDTRAGYWSLVNLQNFITSIHADNPIFPVDIINSLIETLKKKRGRMEYDEWQRSILRFPMLVWPIIRTQSDMQQKLIGYQLFKSLDLRSPDMEYRNRHGAEAKRRWQKRKDACLLICCGWPCCRTRQSLKDDVAEREEERHRRELDRKRAWAERKRRAAGKQLEDLIKREEEENQLVKKKEKEHKEQEDLGYISDKSDDEFTEVEQDEYEDIV